MIRTKKNTILVLSCLILLLGMLSCGVERPIPDVQVSNQSENPADVNSMTKEADNSNTEDVQSDQDEADFNLLTSNKILPENLLQEITFFSGGGGSYCDDLKSYAKPEISSDPTDEELMALSMMITCGWGKDEILEGSIQYPDGRVVAELIQAREEVYSGFYYALLSISPSIEDPIGIYTFTLKGKEGTVTSNAYFRKPDGPRLVLLNNRYVFLSGFAPNERVMLIYYKGGISDIGGSFVGWQEYYVNQAGQLKVKISLSEIDSLAALGPQSGEVHLLHSGPYGGVFQFIEGSILNSPTKETTSYSEDYYLDCTTAMTNQTKLSKARNAKISYNNTLLFANPRQDSRVVDSMPSGTDIYIYGGPYCTDNSIWWKGQFGLNHGYIIEFDGQQYYLK